MELDQGFSQPAAFWTANFDLRRQIKNDSFWTAISGFALPQKG
jgi:hypothetical protein